MEKLGLCGTCGAPVVRESGFAHVCLPPEIPLTREELDLLIASPFKAPIEPHEEGRSR